MTNGPQVKRVRHQLKRRQLTVARVERVAPCMVRVVLSGEELQGFTSLGFDDHVKLFFPSGQEGEESARRDFTPRRFDPTAGELWIDFFLHEAGPAASWAARVTVGDSLAVGGPKSSSLISSEGIDSHLFIGDETALPAISRRLEELSAGASAVVVVEVDDFDWPAPETRAALEVVWVLRKKEKAAPAHELIERLRTLALPPGQCFAWVALESQSARAVRRYLREERGIEKQWIKAAAYWQRGEVGVHDRIED
jgi:NADPH-dependent ferric siderophore reductase